jgi:hypothetical protein
MRGVGRFAYSLEFQWFTENEMPDNTAPTHPLVTIQDRLAAGNLSVNEVCALADRSRTGFYADLKAGLVSIRKIARRTIIHGPVAVAYIAGVTVAASTEGNGATGKCAVGKAP